MLADLRVLPKAVTNLLRRVSNLQGLRLRNGTQELPPGRYKAVRLLHRKFGDTAGMAHYSVLLIPDDRNFPPFRLHAVNIRRESANRFLKNAAGLDFGQLGEADEASVVLLEQCDRGALRGDGDEVLADRVAGMHLSHTDLEMLIASRRKDGSLAKIVNCMAFADLVFEDLADSVVQELPDVEVTSDFILKGSESPPATKPSKLRQVVRPDTVLVIGGTGVGKSTISNMLFNGSSTQLNAPLPVGNGAASVTKDLRAIFSPQHCRLIVDTIGAGDLHIGNQQIVAQIRSVFQRGAMGLSAIVLVVNMQAGLSRGDRANLQLLSRVFDSFLGTHGVIVVTHFCYEAKERLARVDTWLGDDQEARSLFAKFKSIIVTDNNGKPHDTGAAELASACLRDLDAHIQSSRALPPASADMTAFQQVVRWFFSIFRTEIGLDLEQIELELADPQSQSRTCCGCGRTAPHLHACDRPCCKQWACFECQRKSNGLCCACGQPG